MTSPSPPIVVPLLTNQYRYLHWCYTKHFSFSSLLYSSETWARHCTVQSPDSSIHMRDFTWAPCGSYSECPGETTSRTLRFCQKTESVSAETICSQNHLRWLGHVIRMSDERLPKQFLIGELFQGSRTVGRQRKRFKDQASGVLRSCHISPGQLEALTSDRRKWCSACKKGLQLK